MSAKHHIQIWSSLENNIFPMIGDITVTVQKALALIAVLEPLKARAALETLRRIVQRVNEIMEYALTSV
ncbi:phage integrase central domain-containing protein [Salmonella enterica]|uniref:phage integrase central domain-containing protein n=1 Tax=Salmonella enterica TaxID=28901 RepID=UPI00374291E1